MSKKVHTILLIDDDLAINFLHKRLFSKIEIAETIIPSFNGVEAIRDVIQLNNSLNTSDLVFIFLDINMPIMDGWEFLENFKEIHNKLNFNFKIFVLSSSINPDDVEKAKNNCFVTDYYSKPLNSERVNSLLEQYL